MGVTVALLLITVLCTSVGVVTGTCRHVRNDDMLEYTCSGGQLTDLNDLPESTGKIRINNMPISRITVDTFSRFGSELWVLSCTNCGIGDIEPGAFQSLENLQQLSLDSNYLTTIKGSWFKGLNYLTYLDLNYNQIETIEDEVFQNLPNLIDLRLSGNRLQCLNLDAMSNLKELKRMFLSENSEFKCPNAVGTFLENRGVSFEKDPEWNRIPVDLIPMEIPSEYDTRVWRTTTSPSVPTYRERLHLVTTMPPPTKEPYVPHVPSDIYPTEIIYPEYVSPDWYEERPTPSRSFYDDTITPQDPSSTISPTDVETYPYVTFDNLDVTTAQSVPRFMESTPPYYSPHENENKQYERPTYPSETTRTPLLAPRRFDDQGTPPFVETNTHSDTYAWRESVVQGTRYPEYNGPTEIVYPDPSREMPERTHVMRPMPPETVQPVSQENTYQTPYYETTKTIQPPALGNYQERQEEEVSGVVSPLLTTTADKPLPICPNVSGSASSVVQSIQMIIISILLVVMKDVLVEGF